MTDWKLDEKLDQLLSAYEAECVKDGTFDDAFIAAGEEEYSPRRLINEVRQGTPFGRKYANSWQKLQERKIQKYQQPESD